MAKGRLLGGIAALLALAYVGIAGTAAAASTPRGDFTPGVVEPPPSGRGLHGDVRRAPALATASALAAGADVQEIPTADGYTVRVETSPGYVPDRGYDEELVAFLDSLVHGSELDGLVVYVALPSEMSSLCGGQAAACYTPSEGRIAIVGQLEYGGIPVAYAVAHEYGHRIEDYRHNPPFRGGPLAWGTKRWASVKHVCQGAVAGIFAPGNEGRRYFLNPGEAFAESYAWSYFGPGLIEWRWDSRLRPNAAAYAAIRADVLEPWRPQHSERQGFIGRRGAQRQYVLRPRYDGWVQVRMQGSGDLDLGLFDKRNHLIASSARDGSSEKINYVACGQHKLTLVVSAYRARGHFQLRLSTP